MKIFIYYKFTDGPYGGSNQFLKAFKKELEKEGGYTEGPKNAEVILFNSYPLGAEYFFNEIFKLKQKYSEKIIIYRLDGPFYLTRGKDEQVDKIVALFNKLFVDGIIFQSFWCRGKNRQYFNTSSKYETIIHNAPDNEIFNKDGREEFNPKERIKLVATSWSANWRKGFKVYKYLDENLDFSRYEMTFVGNSPVEFRNVKWIKPISSKELAKILKKHDIYITASQNDPCSNSLIEALSCGLPAVALNDGGHPELVQNGGELFESENDIIEKIEKVANNYRCYQSKIPDFSIKKVVQKYSEFARRIYKDAQSERYYPKQISFFTKINFCKMKFMIVRWKMKILKKIRTPLKSCVKIIKLKMIKFRLSC